MYIRRALDFGGQQAPMPPVETAASGEQAKAAAIRV